MSQATVSKETILTASPVAADTVLEQLKAEVGRLFKEQTVRLFVSYERDRITTLPRPYFLFDEGDAGALVWDPLCANVLSKYLLDERKEEGKVGIAVRACDARGIQRMLTDHRLDRDKIYIVGVTCTGIADKEKLAAAGITRVVRITDEGAQYVVVTPDDQVHRLPKEDVILDKCRSCYNHTPGIYDHLIGEEIALAPLEERSYSGVKELEAEDSLERFEFWQNQFERCIRCMACRNVCPACNCRICCFDVSLPRWLGKKMDVAEQAMFHFTRAFHVAGRCIDCHECERVCPMDIPLMKLNHKLMQDVEDLFEIPEAFLPDTIEPLGKFNPADPDFE